MYSGDMPTGSKEQPDAFNEALMKVVRAKMGMLQLDITGLSRLTDIPRSTLSRIINTKRQPDLSQIRLIAIALNQPMPQLMAAAEDVLAGKDPFKA
jgi:transcriptional regulator with XRE-family HTH domain